MHKHYNNKRTADYENRYYTITHTVEYEELSACFSERQIQHGIDYYLGSYVDDFGVVIRTKLRALRKMYRQMCDNPYDVAEVPYITIHYIDGIVTHLPDNHPWHIDYDDERRFDAMLRATLRQYVRQGAAVVGKRRILDLAMRAFNDNTPAEMITPEMRQHVQQWLEHSDAYEELDLTIDDQVHHGVISKTYKELTEDLAATLMKIARRGNTRLDESLFTTAVQSVDRADGEHIELSVDQQEAVRQLLQQPISVLTGYAGVGKSTLIQAVTNYIRMNDQEAQLCAHAGKAAFNLERATGTPARTIASILYSQQPLEVDYLIVDEISMVSEESLLHLLSITASYTHVILLGDRAQLPAVEGVGVMTSLPKFLDSHDIIYTKNLTHVYRQSGQSQLLQAATQIRNHEVPTDYESHDGSIIYRNGSREFVLTNYMSAVERYGADNVNVITPLNRDVEWFNQQLQAVNAKVNGKPGISLLGRTFYPEDKVLVTKNMYGVLIADSDDETIDIFNGFVGKVVSIINGGRPGIRVRFQHVRTGEATTDVDFYEMDKPLGMQHKRNVIPNAEISNLELGYALTVHKSQGSTIKIVLYYLDAGTPTKMLTNELLYTALTRASDRLLFVTNQPLSERVLAPFVHATAYSVKTSYLADALENDMAEVRGQIWQG